MKKIISILLLGLCFSAKSQTVDALVFPFSLGGWYYNGDTITIIAKGHIWNSAVKISQTYSVSGLKILASANYCADTISILTNTIDTFKILPLSPGYYSFVYTLNKYSSSNPPTLTCDLLSNTGISNKDSILIWVDKSTSIGESQTESSINIFPNPVSDKLTALIADKSIKQNSIIRIVNIQGKILLTQSIENEKEEINVTELPNGFYIFQLVIDNQVIENKKFIKF